MSFELQPSRVIVDSDSVTIVVKDGVTTISHPRKEYFGIEVTGTTCGELVNAALEYGSMSDIMDELDEDDVMDNLNYDSMAEHLSRNSDAETIMEHFDTDEILEAIDPEDIVKFLDKETIAKIMLGAA